MKLSACFTLVLLIFMWALPAGADWVSGETSMSRLPDDVRERMINNTLDLSYAMKHGIKPENRKPLPKTDFPAYWNWHDMDGADWMTPVRDQGQCGSCWTFGSLGAMEALINIYKNDPDFDYDLSEQFMVACGGGSCNYGGASEEVLEYIKKKGIPDELCYPYIEEEGVCSDACDDFLTRLVKIKEWSIMLAPTTEELKAEVMNGPIPVTMRVVDNFFRYRSGIYQGFTEACTLTYLPPNHIVTLVGWNDAHDSWIARNSWGFDWGQDGYFEIKRGTSCFAVTTTDWLRIDPKTVPEERLNIGLCAPEYVEKVIEADSEVADVSMAFELENCGELKISWHIEEDITWRGWLTVAPTAGHLNPGESVDLQFTAATSILQPGIVVQPLKIKTSNGPIIYAELRFEKKSEEIIADGDEELEEDSAEESSEDGDTEESIDEDSGSSSGDCNSAGSPALPAGMLLLALMLRIFKRKRA